MQLYMKSSSLQRLVAYLVDILLIIFVATFLANVVSNIAGFDSKRYSELMDLILDRYNEYIKDTEIEEGLVEYVGKDNIKEFFKLYLEMFAYQVGCYLVLSILYLVVLPYYWEKQTLGRALAKIKVIRHTGDVKCKISDLILREILGTFFLYLVLSFGSIVGLLPLISALVASISGRSLVDRISGCDLVMFNPVTVDAEQQASSFKFENPNDFNQNNNSDFNQNNDYNYNDKRKDSIDAEVKDNNDSSDDDSEDEYIVI